MEIKISKNDSIGVKDLKPGQNKKPSKKDYPKAMTIRYEKDQDKEIESMMIKMGEKTMSKAFLKAPITLSNMYIKIKLAEEQHNKDIAEIYELRNVVRSWQDFINKLDNFVNKKELVKLKNDDENDFINTDDREKVEIKIGGLIGEN